MKEFLIIKEYLIENVPKEEIKECLQKFDEFNLNNIDLFKIIPQFLIWLLSDKQYGIYQFANDETKPIINEIVELYYKHLNNETIDQDNWIKLQNKARVAYAAAARAAARADAYFYAPANAAEAVALAYAIADDDIAYAAYYAAVRAHVHAHAYAAYDDTDYGKIAKIQVEKLLQLLSEAPQLTISKI